MGGHYGVTSADIERAFATGLIQRPEPTVHWGVCSGCKGSGRKYPVYIKDDSKCPKCSGRGIEDVSEGWI